MDVSFLSSTPLVNLTQYIELLMYFFIIGCGIPPLSLWESVHESDNDQIFTCRVPALSPSCEAPFYAVVIGFGPLLFR